jgi:DNA helicase-2/ATP-dependent DNA helicase PcrA
MSQKLGTVCNILDSYSNVPSSSNRENMLGSLYTSSQPNAGISFTWRKSFYYSLLGLLASEGLNESEDEIENFPKGKVPIMTIHQSKGLEFPIVFVYGLSNSRKKDDTSAYLESVFDRYKSKIVMTPNKFTDEQRGKQDTIRLFYVAYSRAQYALILLAKNSEYTKPGIGFGGNSKWTVFKGAKQI